MKVGYLHLGREGGGVRRYGLMIAEATRARTDATVLEVDGGERDTDRHRLAAAGRALMATEVVHLQWKPADWGGGLRALVRLRAFASACDRPLVVTLHDVWERTSFRRRWVDSDAWALRWLGRAVGRHGGHLVVHGQEELRRLVGLVPAESIAVVPHFVEERASLDDAGVGSEAGAAQTAEAGAQTAIVAREALGLGGKRVITILGFMVRRKGYRLTIEALRFLPADVVALFAGGPIAGREARADELRAYAEQLGVGERVTITGYVASERLEQALTATHVAICPFRDLSASGSLSTWISAGRPIVTSDLPQFREYDELEPGALRIFQPLSAEGLAGAVRAVLEEGPPMRDPRVVALAERLATPRVVERYLEVYRASLAPDVGDRTGSA
ncbi:MAG: glycosyltransferase [Chloroflexota bacterium]|nr:glycosyltransferase [Chloroflexota bacterium]